MNTGTSRTRRQCDLWRRQRSCSDRSGSVAIVMGGSIFSGVRHTHKKIKLVVISTKYLLYSHPHVKILCTHWRKAPPSNSLEFALAPPLAIVVDRSMMTNSTGNGITKENYYWKHVYRLLSTYCRTKDLYVSLE